MAGRLLDQMHFLFSSCKDRKQVIIITICYPMSQLPWLWILGGCHNIQSDLLHAESRDQKIKLTAKQRKLKVNVNNARVNKISQSNKANLFSTKSTAGVCEIISNDAALLTSGLDSLCYRASVFMFSPCARRYTGSCHQGRRADGWGLRGDGSAAEPAGCHLGTSRGQHSGSKSHRRKQTGRGWSQSRRWCRFGPAFSLQRRQESGIWQGFQPF